jgi:SAM-dependent methyltransferase
MSGAPMQRGWFDIPGVQEGDRTLAEQMTGLDGLAELVRGRTVLDLGCAEGLIALECARMGAARVDAIDYKIEFIDRARKLKLPEGATLNWFYHNLEHGLPDGTLPQYDVVLALAIIHKMPQPAALTRLIADTARQILIVRLPLNSKGVVRSKHNGVATCDIPADLQGAGWQLADVRFGPMNERVHFYRHMA